jgi:hypothetical protein
MADTITTNYYGGLNFILNNDIASPLTVKNPIGSDSAAYGGEFNGNGRKVTLNISGTSNYVGMFAMLDATANIHDLGLTGNVSGGNYVGAIAGINNGMVANVESNVTVVGSGIVGGLVGQNGAGAIITNAFVEAAIGASTPLTATTVGGMVGENMGTISFAYTTGGVNVVGDNVGGLVGKNSGAINNAYATGNATGTNYVGGLVGDSVAGTITNAYATGNVSGTVAGRVSGTAISGGGINVWEYADASLTATTPATPLANVATTTDLYDASWHESVLNVDNTGTALAPLMFDTTKVDNGFYPHLKVSSGNANIVPQTDVKLPLAAFMTDNLNTDSNSLVYVSYVDDV